MKVAIKVGDVELQASGLDMDQRQIRQLLKAVASIAVAIAAETDTEPEEPERPPMGFSAHIERATEVAEDYSEYFEE